MHIYHTILNLKNSIDNKPFNDKNISFANIKLMKAAELVFSDVYVLRYACPTLAAHNVDCLALTANSQAPGALKAGILSDFKSSE